VTRYVSKYAGRTVKVDGDELLVVREEDVMGVFEHEQEAKKVARFFGQRFFSGAEP
jgi:uncharacterized beta-barrel protein YwiB (DUF1934 family)